MKTACEDAVWNILPRIRASIAWVMVREYRLKPHQVSECLGVSKAAVSQYLSGKRGKVFSEEHIMAAVRATVEDSIKREDHKIKAEDLCRICQIYRGLQP